MEDTSTYRAAAFRISRPPAFPLVARRWCTRTGRFVGFFLGLALLSVPTLAGLPVVRIGMVVDGPWEGNPEARALTIREIETLTRGEFDVRFPEDAYRIGDWTRDRAEANLHQLIEDPTIDLVISWGLVASHAVCCLGELPKPVIAPVVLDPHLQGFPLDRGRSGVHNLSYVAMPDTLRQELDQFAQIVPFERVAILTSAALLESIPEIRQRTLDGLEGSAYQVDFVPVGTSARETLEAIPSSADAVYSWPLFHFSDSEMATLIEGLSARGLPSFAGLDQGEVEAGMLATAGSPDFLPRLTRRIALNTQRILLGEPASEIPVEFSVRETLKINMATVRAIGVSPPWEILIEAELLHPEALEDAYELSLDDAISEAVDLNLDLLVRARELEAGAQDVAQAASLLGPGIDLRATGVAIDSDRAAASLGSQAERTTSLSATATQLLYSDAALANLEVRRRVQSAREWELETARLDIALEAGVTFLNLLRAQALQRVQRNNVVRTLEHLDAARLRRDLGVASSGEVLRWESEIASARKSLVEAVAQRRIAGIAINRLLHRPQASVLVVEDIEVDRSEVLSGQLRFRELAGTPRSYEIVNDYVVRDGIARAPELASIDAALAAQRRRVVASKRSLWSPNVAVVGSLEEILSRSGAGSDGADALPSAIPRTDDTNWSLAVDASLPLWTSGERRAERIQAELELEALQIERTAVEEKIEQRIRAALEEARASLVGTRLTRQGSEAAGRNLELVETAYGRGATSLLDLLDAQTAARNAEEQAANAVYDFLIDFLVAVRAAGTLSLEGAERADWLAGLENHLATGLGTDARANEVEE